MTGRAEPRVVGESCAQGPDGGVFHRKPEDLDPDGLHLLALQEPRGLGVRSAGRPAVEGLETCGPARHVSDCVAIPEHTPSRVPLDFRKPRYI